MKPKADLNSVDNINMDSLSSSDDSFHSFSTTRSSSLGHGYVELEDDEEEHPEPRMWQKVLFNKITIPFFNFVLRKFINPLLYVARGREMHGDDDDATEYLYLEADDNDLEILNRTYFYLEDEYDDEDNYDDGVDDYDEFENPHLNQLHCAAYNGDVSKVRRLLDDGNDVNQGTRGGSNLTPLMHAVSGGQLEMVKLLLQHGADMSIESEASGLTSRFTAVSFTMWASCHQRVTAEILDTLLVHCSDSVDKFLIPNCPEFGYPLLYLAVSKGYVEYVRVLLKHGASLEQRFRVPDDSSSDSDDSEPYRLIDDVDVPPRAPRVPRPPRTQTVLEFAERSGLVEMVDILRREAARRATEPVIPSLLELSRREVRLLAGQGGRSVEIKIDAWVKSGVLSSSLKPYILYKHFEY